MYLVDTNVWLEYFLNQECANDVQRFLSNVYADELYITDFAFHSIGIILSKFKKTEVLSEFVKDIFIENPIHYVGLEPCDTEILISYIKEYNMDFDDAYQYTAAEKYNLEIVSFDAGFDKTKRGRKSPSNLFK
ncbi:MAG: PIN domain-containing protein [Spirochaetes bacterium]|nr:PIN domain-containing protein [Spirochaetota bacterium]